MLNKQKILVLGLAKSGFFVTKLLYKENEIIVVDQSDQDQKKIQELKNLKVSFIKSATGEEILDDSFDLVIKNPGISPNHPCILKAQSLNIKVVNEMEVAYHYLPKDVKIIGITGSNGKTTTTTILYDLLKLHGIDAVLGGNIGYPLSEVIPFLKINSVLVLEISDHQLNDLEDFKTDYSVLTNICETHLDFHGSYERYKLVKRKIFNHHNQKDIAIINAKDSDSLVVSKDILSTKRFFNNTVNYYNEEGIFLDNKLVVKKEDIKIKGNHNYENILAALLVLKDFQLNLEIVRDYLKKFNGVEHRIEIVPVNSSIEFYNDSKATNPNSVITALKVMDKKVHLILGGMERKQNFHELDAYLDKVEAIYAIGEVTERIANYAKEVGITCIKCYTLKESIEKLKEIEKEIQVILLSPGSASWDQYDKFETRGEEFKKLVEKYFDKRYN